MCYLMLSLLKHFLLNIFIKPTDKLIASPVSTRRTTDSEPAGNRPCLWRESASPGRETGSLVAAVVCQSKPLSTCSAELHTYT